MVPCGTGFNLDSGKLGALQRLLAISLDFKFRDFDLCNSRKVKNTICKNISLLFADFLQRKSLRSEVKTSKVSWNWSLIEWNLGTSARWCVDVRVGALRCFCKEIQTRGQTYLLGQSFCICLVTWGHVSFDWSAFVGILCGFLWRIQDAGRGQTSTVCVEMSSRWIRLMHSHTFRYAA